MALLHARELVIFSSLGSSLTACMIFSFMGLVLLGPTEVSSSVLIALFAIVSGLVFSLTQLSFIS